MKSNKVIKSNKSLSNQSTSFTTIPACIIKLKLKHKDHRNMTERKAMRYLISKAIILKILDLYKLNNETVKKLKNITTVKQYKNEYLIYYVIDKNICKLPPIHSELFDILYLSSKEGHFLHKRPRFKIISPLNYAGHKYGSKVNRLPKIRQEKILELYEFFYNNRCCLRIE